VEFARCSRVDRVMFACISAPPNVWFGETHYYTKNTFPSQ
jgi:hypothetical protein